MHYSFFFKSHRRKRISFQRFHLSNPPSTSKKRVRETPPKSKPKTHQRQKRGRGSGEGWGWWRLGLCSVSPSNPENMFMRLKSPIVRYTCFVCHPNTHTRRHSYVLFLAKADTHTHTHTQASVMKTVSNSRCVPQMVQLTVTFPDRCRIKRTFKIRGAPRTR